MRRYIALGQEVLHLMYVFTLLRNLFIYYGLFNFCRHKSYYVELA